MINRRKGLSHYSFPLSVGRSFNDEEDCILRSLGADEI